ncbi:hypothetical protein QNO00_14885 [Arthrobacter sp. zg-Y1219]|uniref:hypothetical protein n=1 Tax=Arthrobacter sp. zg-Y1219 TaxID=3049067 RepID=UPI0024C3731C|nr:hypothetical protein [Arthrobacter sp. zg-Y1219]MDK1361543.1 hypothetical protein [Arthrobacter sp. zg-Y1219]
MEPGMLLLIVIAATTIFVLAVVFLLRRFKKINAEKYPPATEGRKFEIRPPQ